MTIRLPYIDHIKVLFRNLINDKDVDLNRPWNYEVQILPSSIQRGNQQSPVSSAHSIKTVPTVIAPWVATRASRLWSANQESSWHVEHTRSNLG